MVVDVFGLKNNMIITKLTGGLGNQMFQYAIGRSLAEKNNTELKLDVSWFNSQKGTPRKYGLTFFKILENIATDKEIKKLELYKKRSGIKYFFNNLFFANNSIYITENSNIFNKNILKNKNKDIYLNGYWQNEKYFNDIRKIILKEFTLKDESSLHNKKIKKLIEDTNSVSIHIRRGDYIEDKKTNIVHGTCSLDYYQDAIKKISKYDDNLNIFVFSDEIKWVKNNLKTILPIIFVEGNKDYEDIILMSLCKHNIIANSSFSWWGAWLNQNPNKMIVAPKKWFNDLEKNKNNSIPKTWIKL